MAGPNLFHVYDDSSKEVVGTYLTQGEADSAASTGQTAYVGGLNEAQDREGNTVDAGIYVAPNDGWFHYDTAPVLRQVRPDPYPIRSAVRRWHKRHEHLASLLLQDFIRLWKPPEDITLGEGILHGLCVGTYMMWQRVIATTIDAAEFVQWLTNSAMGPADATRSVCTVPLGASGSFKVTLPAAVDGTIAANNWTLQVAWAASGANAVNVNTTTRVVRLSIHPALTAAQARTLLATASEFAEADVVISDGDDSHTFPQPAADGDPAANYDFSGAVEIYDPANPDTFFDIASMIPADSALRMVAGKGLSVADWDTAGFPRLTVAQMLSTSKNVPGTVPTVAQLDNGDWINELINA